jgi:sigma-B regulation protein RsbU (phosphoserine phosphatase)
VHTARVEIATVLQEALLPTALPAVPGWALAAHYRAAGEANEVGGDFYDVVVLEDGTVLALVGDVAGKGARAAALTARTRHTLVTAAALGGGDPTAGLTLLNAALQREDGLELCSVAAVVLRGAEATVLSAGHPRPLLVRDGALTELGAPSPMLGAAPEEQAWRTTRHALRPGDLLVLHTDGVTDAVGREARFGDARLRDALLAGPAEAQAAIDRVTAHLDAFEHGPQADDRALLALERRR